MLNNSMNKFDELYKKIMESMVVGGDASVLGPNAQGEPAKGDMRIPFTFGIQRRNFPPTTSRTRKRNKK
jgi:hypothetical protein